MFLGVISVPHDTHWAQTPSKTFQNHPPLLET